MRSCLFEEAPVPVDPARPSDPAPPPHPLPRRARAPAPPAAPARPSDPLLLRDWRPVAQLRTRRTEVRRPAVDCVDVHNHLGTWLSDDGDWLVPDVDALLRVLDECGVATVVNLDGRW